MQEARGASDLFLIDSAVKAGIRPTAMLFHNQPRGKWNKWDFLCLEAYYIVEGERCGQCRLPRWICHDESGDVGAHIRDDVCYVTRQVEAKKNDGTATKKDRDQWGVALKPDPYTYSKKPLDAEFREAFYKAESEKAGALVQPES